VSQSDVVDAIKQYPNHANNFGRLFLPANRNLHYPFDGFEDIGKRIRVAKTQISVAEPTERGAPQTCNSRFVEKQVKDRVTVRPTALTILPLHFMFRIGRYGWKPFCLSSAT
jgi:hypothetical protein